jgi:magnesium chelatase subunit I
MRTRAGFLGELDPRKHAPSSVRDEIRRNVIRKLRAGEDLFPGIVGFDQTVVPQIVNALLARHDIVFLGLRGQAKTRLCRMLVNFLDAEIPVIAGSLLREHPLQPITAASRARVEAEGKDLPIEWLTPEERYGEKLATPDVTMADLIGDIDPLKAAHKKLDLASEDVIHYGIIPRLNRGIFAINELPDLAPRIQVGLLNILEERDIQIRGFPVRIPLDLLMVSTANPEDYTNRGSIITPLKDRIASQILTHYPHTLADAKRITGGEAWLDRGNDLPAVRIPEFMADIIEEIAFRGRNSEYVDQKSGVSARLPIAAQEVLVSQVERRLARNGKSPPVPRLIDLAQAIPAITGKVELVYEGEQEGAVQVARHLLGAACKTIFDRHFPDAIREGSEPALKNDRYKPVLGWFAAGNKIEISDETDDAAYRAALEKIPGLQALADEFLPAKCPHARTCVMELIIEGLHQHALLAKEDVATGAAYSDMLGLMLEGLK